MLLFESVQLESALTALQSIQKKIGAIAFHDGAQLANGTQFTLYNCTITTQEGYAISFSSISLFPRTTVIIELISNVFVSGRIFFEIRNKLPTLFIINNKMRGVLESFSKITRWSAISNTSAHENFLWWCNEGFQTPAFATVFACGVMSIPLSLPVSQRCAQKLSFFSETDTPRDLVQWGTFANNISRPCYQVENWPAETSTTEEDFETTAEEFETTNNEFDTTAQESSGTEEQQQDPESTAMNSSYFSSETATVEEPTSSTTQPSTTAVANGTSTNTKTEQTNITSPSPPQTTQQTEATAAAISRTVVVAKEIIPIPTSPPPPLVQTAEQASSAVGVVVAMSSVASVTGGQLGVANAMVRLTTCGDGSGDNSEEEGSAEEDASADLPILVHPFRFRLGEGKGKNGQVNRAYAAAALSNTLFIPAILAFVIYFPMRLVVSRVRGVDAESALTSIGWPSLLVLPFATLAEGIGVSIVKSLTAKDWKGGGGGGGEEEEGIDGVSVVMGVVGLLLTSAFFAAWLYVLVKKVPRHQLELLENDLSCGEDEDDNCAPAPNKASSSLIATIKHRIDYITSPMKMWSPIEVDDEDDKQGENREDAQDRDVDDGHQVNNHRGGRREDELSPPANKLGGGVSLSVLERFGNTIGDKRFFYAEFLSFVCSLAVGVIEGIEVEQGDGCKARAVTALLFAILQCVCSITALIPFELFFQIVLSLCIVPLSFLVTIKVFQSDDGTSDNFSASSSSSSGGGIIASFTPSPSTVDSMLATLSVVSNAIGMTLMLMGIVVGIKGIVTSRVDAVVVASSSSNSNSNSNSNNNTPSRGSNGTVTSPSPHTSTVITTVEKGGGGGGTRNAQRKLLLQKRIHKESEAKKKIKQQQQDDRNLLRPPPLPLTSHAATVASLRVPLPLHDHDANDDDDSLLIEDTFDDVIVRDNIASNGGNGGGAGGRPITTSTIIVGGNGVSERNNPTTSTTNTNSANRSADNDDDDLLAILSDIEVSHSQSGRLQQSVTQPAKSEKDGSDGDVGGSESESGVIRLSQAGRPNLLPVGPPPPLWQTEVLDEIDRMIEEQLGKKQT